MLGNKDHVFMMMTWIERKVDLVLHNLKDTTETVLPQSDAASAENTQTGVDSEVIFAYK